MSKKNLLSESEIRRFQGLAGIPAISTEGYYKGARHEDEEEMEEGMHLDGEREEEMGDEPMGDEPMGELDLSPEQKEDLAADIVRAVAQELSSALDLEEPIEVETDGGEDMEMDLEMGDDEEMDLEVGDEPMGDEEEPEGMRYMEETEEPVEEAVEETIEETTEESIEESEELEESNNEELVNEVLRRVIARLSNK